MKNNHFFFKFQVKHFSSYTYNVNHLKKMVVNDMYVEFVDIATVIRVWCHSEQKCAHKIDESIA